MSRCLAAAALAAVLALTAGCGTDLLGGALVDRRAELEARPSLEQAVAHYDDMLTQLRDRLSTDVGPLAWEIARPPGGAGCGTDFSGLDGSTATTELWLVRQNIPDDDWTRAVQIATEILTRSGFDPPTPLVDRPGDHEIVAYDRFGAYFVFGTKEGTILRISTGCHLPDAARTAATPT